MVDSCHNDGGLIILFLFMFTSAGANFHNFAADFVVFHACAARFVTFLNFSFLVELMSVVDGFLLILLNVSFFLKIVFSETFARLISGIVIVIAELFVPVFKTFLLLIGFYERFGLFFRFFDNVRDRSFINYSLRFDNFFRLFRFDFGYGYFCRFLRFRYLFSF